MSGAAGTYIADALWSEIVHGEILSLTAALRRNDRFASSPWEGRLVVLRQLLESVRGEIMDLSESTQSLSYDISHVFHATAPGADSPTPLTLPVILSPFLDLLSSGNTTGPIASAVFTSLTKFLSYNLLQGTPEQLTDMMASFADSVTNFKFEPTDAEADGVVLMRFLQVLESCLESNAGAFLTDEAVCKMMETCFVMCSQMRISEQVRRAAEHTLAIIVRVIFSRVKSLSADDDADARVAVGVILKDNAQWDPVRGRPASPAASVPSSPTSASMDDDGAASRPSSPDVPLASVSSSLSLSAPRRAFGIVSARELIARLCKLIDPNNMANTDTMRAMALTVARLMLELSGRSVMRLPSLRRLVCDGLARNLFAVVMAKEPRGSVLLSLALRATLLLFSVSGGALRAHIEYFLVHALRRMQDDPRAVALAASNGVAYVPTPEQVDQREQLLLAIGHLAAAPYFYVSLYVNFDCAPHASDVMDELVRFLVALARGSVSNASVSSSAYALELVTAFLSQLQERCQGRRDARKNGGGVAMLSQVELQQRRARKRVFQTGVQLFNESAKKGIVYFVEQGVVSSETAHDEIAALLRTTPTMSKQVIGEFVSKLGNEALLSAFAKAFDFHHLRVDEALRMFLESLRLPGESQPIERIMDAFAAEYVSVPVADIADKDACFILSYGIMMLNTDQHNPQVRKRMTLEDFTRNHRKTNAGGDFAPEFLQAIYENIRSNEIVLPEEHDNAVGEDYRWRKLLNTDKAVGPMTPCATNIYDRELFVSVAPTLLEGLVALLRKQREPRSLADQVSQSLLPRTLSALGLLASVAAHYEQADVLEAVMDELAQMSLLQGGASDADFMLKFGSDANARAAAVIMFELARHHGSSLASHWSNIVASVCTLLSHRLLPSSIFVVEDMQGNRAELPQPADRPPARNGGLFSFLWQGSSDNAEYEAALKAARECAAACAVPELLEETDVLTESSVTHLLSALAAASRTPIGPDGATVLDPVAAPLLLETMVRVVLRNKDRAPRIWAPLHAHLMLVLSDAHAPPLLIERAHVSVFRLAHRLVQSDAMAPSLVETIRLLASPASPAIDAQTAVHRASGVDVFVRAHWANMRSGALWRAILTVLRACAGNADAAAIACELVAFLFDDGEASLFAEPFEVFGDVAELLLRVIAEAAPQTRASISAAARSSPAQQAAGGVSRSGTPVASSREDAQAPSLRAIKALTMLAGLAMRVGDFRARVLQSCPPESLPFPVRPQGGDAASNVDDEARTTLWLFERCWLKVLTGLGQNSCHPLRPVRAAALTLLQKTLMLPDLAALAPEQKAACFHLLVFPLLDNLLASPVAAADLQGGEGLEEVRIRACNMMCKLFLHDLAALAQRSDFVALWMRVIDYVQRYIALNSDQLTDTLRESLKNMLLVMSTSAVLVDPATDPANRAVREPLWTATWTSIGSFLPSMQQELFPDETAAAHTEATPVAPAAPQQREAPLQREAPATTAAVVVQKESVEAVGNEPSQAPSMDVL